MKEWLNKEYVVKRKIWDIAIEILLDTFISLSAVYYLLSECSIEIADILTQMHKAGAALDVVLISAPIVIMFIGFIKVGYYYTASIQPEKAPKTSKTTTKKNKKR